MKCFQAVLLSEDGFGYLGSFVVPHKCWDDSFYFCEKYHWNLVGIAFAVHTAFGRMHILTISVLPFCECGVSFHCFVSSSVSSSVS